jgi:hypothetical protein
MDSFSMIYLEPGGLCSYKGLLYVIEHRKRCQISELELVTVLLRLRSLRITLSLLNIVDLLNAIVGSKVVMIEKLIMGAPCNIQHLVVKLAMLVAESYFSVQRSLMHMFNRYIYWKIY